MTTYIQFMRDHRGPDEGSLVLVGNLLCLVSVKVGKEVKKHLGELICEPGVLDAWKNPLEGGDDLI